MFKAKMYICAMLEGPRTQYLRAGVYSYIILSCVIIGYMAMYIIMHIKISLQTLHKYALRTLSR